MNYTFSKLSRICLFAFSIITAHCAYSVAPDTVTDSLRQNAENLFEEQTIYLHEYAVVHFGSSFPYTAYPESASNAIVNRLNLNESSIGNYFGQFYGASIGNQIAGFFSTYNEFAFQLVDAVRTNNTSQTQAVLTQWKQYAASMAAYFQIINPYIQANVFGPWLQAKINFEALQIIYLRQDNYNSSIANYDQARNLARALSDYVSLGIARAFNLP